MNGSILSNEGLCACVPAVCCATPRGCCTPSTPTGGPEAAEQSDDAWAPPTGNTVKGQAEKCNNQIEIRKKLYQGDLNGPNIYIYIYTYTNVI